MAQYLPLELQHQKLSYSAQTYEFSRSRSGGKALFSAPQLSVRQGWPLHNLVSNQPTKLKSGHKEREKEKT